MSPRRRFGPPDEHDRARELASQRLDEPLLPADAAWLVDHLDACAPCRFAAADFEAQRGLLRALRDAAPVPPRDLWARTAAAIEAAGTRSRRPTRALLSPVFHGIPRGPVAVVLVVAVVVGAGLLNGSGVFAPGRGVSPLPTPISVTAGEIRVLTQALDGSVALSTRRYDQICPIGAAACRGAVTGDDTTLATRIADLGNVDAYLSPAQDSIIVMQRGSGPSGVFVVSVRPPSTPPPTASATATPAVATPSPAATTRPSGAASVEPASPTPVLTPGRTPDSSLSPTPATSGAPSIAPSSSPGVDVTPAPDGTIQIARDVIVVGSVSGYSPDGTQFAFSARPADGSSGPDVYVWDTTDSEARRVTTDHASIFASWIDNRLLVSRIADGAPTTTLLDPASGAEDVVPTGNAWRPATGPGGRTAVWWDGSLAPSGDGFTWLPATGRLVLGAWVGASQGSCPTDAPTADAASSVPAGDASGAPATAPTSTPSPCVIATPTATPIATSTATPTAVPPATPIGAKAGNGQHLASTAGRPSPHGGTPIEGSPSPSSSTQSGVSDGATSLQVLATSPLRDWQVRWDESGTTMALWVSAATPNQPGRLSLYAVDPVTGAANLDQPLLADAPAFEGFSLRGGRLTWSAPTASGDAAVEVLVWSGDAIGRLEMRIGRMAALVR